MLSSSAAKSLASRSPDGHASFENVSPEQSARDARCRYVDDSKPGFTRKAHGKHFRYFDVQGKAIRDKEIVARIRSIVIPPAWTQVWICPLENGHIQATGRDARGRKQYRYHPRFREVREEAKYERLVAFAEALPSIRKAIDNDLNLPGLPREKVLATVVRLLELTLIRVGNEEYARENQSFGLTTLQTRHVDIHGSTLRFRFRGKSGVEHNVRLQDRRLAKILQRCYDLPGQELFAYLDENGERQSVESVDANEYIQRIAQAEFTAKDFRTWGGTVLATQALLAVGVGESQTHSKRLIAQAIKEVAMQLRNTPAVCRKCYVHPLVLERYQTGGLSEAFSAPNPAAELSVFESKVLRFLQENANAGTTAKTGKRAIRALKEVLRAKTV